MIVHCVVCPVHFGGFAQNLVFGTAQTEERASTPACGALGAGPRDLQQHRHGRTAGVINVQIVRQLR